MGMVLTRGSSGVEVRKLRQALVRELDADAADFTNLGAGDAMDGDVEAAVRRWQAGIGLIADGIGEMITERTDKLIEATIGRPLARPVLSEMKENAELSCNTGRGGDLLVSSPSTQATAGSTTTWM